MEEKKQFNQLSDEELKKVSGGHTWVDFELATEIFIGGTPPGSMPVCLGGIDNPECKK